MATKLIAALTAALWSFATDAAAECAYPGPAMFPAPGTPVRPDGVLFFFQPERDPQLSPVLRDEVGQEVSWTATVFFIGGTPAYRVYRIDLKAGSAKRLNVELPNRWGEHAQLVYPISGSPKRNPIGAVEVIKIVESSYRWRCSSESAWQLTPSIDAPAYAVEWASSKADYVAGRRLRIILPRSTSALYGAHHMEAMITLGQISCFGPTLTWPSDEIYIGVSALLGDGTETPLPSVPIKLLRPAPATQGRE